MLQISRADYEKMVSYAKKLLPEEACGLIAGTADGELKRIKKIYLLTNTDHNSTHYFMDSKEQLEAVHDMRKEGLSMLGNWHSHPKAPAVFSSEDKRLAYDSSLSYLILSLMGSGEPQLKAFTVSRTKKIEEEHIVIMNRLST